MSKYRRSDAVRIEVIAATVESIRPDGSTVVIDEGGKKRRQELHPWWSDILSEHGYSENDEIRLAFAHLLAGVAMGLVVSGITAILSR